MSLIPDCILRTEEQVVSGTCIIHFKYVVLHSTHVENHLKTIIKFSIIIDKLILAFIGLRQFYWYISSTMYRL